MLLCWLSNNLLLVIPQSLLICQAHELWWYHKGQCPRCQVRQPCLLSQRLSVPYWHVPDLFLNFQMPCGQNLYFFTCKEWDLQRDILFFINKAQYRWFIIIKWSTNALPLICILLNQLLWLMSLHVWLICLLKAFNIFSRQIRVGTVCWKQEILFPLDTFFLPSKVNDD